MLTFGCPYPTGCRLRGRAYAGFQEETRSFHQNQKFWRSIFWSLENPLRREEIFQMRKVDDFSEKCQFNIGKCFTFWWFSTKCVLFLLCNISSRRRGFFELQKMDFQNFWFWWKPLISSWKRVYAHPSVWVDTSLPRRYVSIAWNHWNILCLWHLLG